MNAESKKSRTDYTKDQPWVTDSSRIPPHNPEVEQALLGTLLLNNKAYEKVAEFLKPDHFSISVHGTIYMVIGDFITHGNNANPVTLKTYFEKDEALKDVGGSDYLASLAGFVVSIINAVDYAKIIFELHQRRELIDIGTDIVNKAFESKQPIPIKDQIGFAESKLYDLAESDKSGGDLIDFDLVCERAVEQAEISHKLDGRLAGVTTGLTDLDNALGGLHPSDLIILAGRPGMGKSSLAMNIAFEAAKANNHVAFFSLEMSDEQLATRVIASVAQIDSQKVRQGRLSDFEFERFIATSKSMKGLPLYLDDTGVLSLSAIRTRSRRLKRTKGLNLIVIDYLQLMATSKAENRVQEITKLTAGLKALAKELNVPVLVLSQLSRTCETRADKRPLLSDLRESGSIEQDADIVMFAYREGYYRQKEEEDGKLSEPADENLSELIIEKNRHGATTTVFIHFEGQFTRFSDLEKA